jgi:hypothetical protein
MADTKATRPSPMPGLSEAEFEARAREERKKRFPSPVFLRMVKSYEQAKKAEKGS